MSYTKHTWTNGETITAAKLNNIENGIEAATSGDSGIGSVIVTVEDVLGEPLNLTWQEIYDASFNSVVVLVNTLEYRGDTSSEYYKEVDPMESCYYDAYDNPEYPYCVIFGDHAWFFNCASPDDYPCGYHGS